MWIFNILGVVYGSSDIEYIDSKDRFYKHIFVNSECDDNLTTTIRQILDSMKWVNIVVGQWLICSMELDNIIFAKYW